VKRSNVSRRRFILALPILVVTLIAGRFLTRQLGRDAFEEEMIRIVRKNLPYLRVADGAISSFARDLQKYEAGFSGASVQALKDSETTLCEKFLLSTDFFWNGSELDRDVHYRAYHDPYISRCANPFFYQPGRSQHSSACQVAPRTTFAGSS